MPIGGGLSRIRYGILALAAVILLIVGAGVVIVTLEERRDQIEHARIDSLSLARAVERYVDGTIDATGVELQDVRAVVEASGGPERIDPRRLDARVAERPMGSSHRRNILVAGADGTAIAFSGGGTSIVPSVSERAFFLGHRSDSARGPVLSAPFRARTDGRWRLPVSVRVDRPDGSFGGVVVTTLDVEHLTGYFATLDVRYQGAVALVSSAGEFIARHPPLPNSSSGWRSAGVARILEGGEGHIDMLSPIDGAERVGSYRRIGEYPLYVAVTLGREPLLATWRRNSILRLLGGMGVLAATGIFTLLLLRRLRDERAATSSLATFRHAVDLSGDFIYWVDSQGRIVYMNEAASRRAGLDAGQVAVDFHLSRISANFTDKRWHDLRGQLLATGEARYLSEHSAHDDSVYPVQVCATHLRVDGQDFAFLICRDLSEQVRQEAEVRELNTSLERRVQERTAELGSANAELESFTRAVSHDLRAPLNHLTAYAELLKETGGANRDECARLTDKIVERSAYMHELVDALLALSRVSSAALDRRDVDLSRMANDIVSEHRKLEPTREVRLTVEPGMRASADHMLLRVLLENLVGNAWKYSSREANAHIEVFSEETDHGRGFAVRDNGVGFDPRQAARLFGAFQRLHTQGEFPGNGVGPRDRTSHRLAPWRPHLGGIHARRRRHLSLHAGLKKLDPGPSRQLPRPG